MAKKSMIERELKRQRLVEQYAAKRAGLKAIANDETKPMEERFKAARDEDQHYVDLAVESGMEYFELTDEQLAPIAEKVRAEVWPQMEPDVGKEIMDLIRAQVK